MSSGGDGISCLHKLHGGNLPNPKPDTDMTTVIEGDSDDQVSNEDSSFQANKKTDEVIVPPMAPTGGYLWRFSTGVISTTTGAITGAVGMSVGGVKWVAGKGYNAGTAVGSAVLDTTKSVVSKVPVPTLKRKSKKE